MKVIGILLGTMGASLLAVSLACANPAMLPKHPGYPAKGKSPATGQATANDQGQGNTNNLAASTMSHDSAAMNDVSDPQQNACEEVDGCRPVTGSRRRSQQGQYQSCWRDVNSH